MKLKKIDNLKDIHNYYVWHFCEYQAARWILGNFPSEVAIRHKKVIGINLSSTFSSVKLLENLYTSDSCISMIRNCFWNLQSRLFSYSLGFFFYIYIFLLVWISAPVSMGNNMIQSIAADPVHNTIRF